VSVPPSAARPGGDAWTLVYEGYRPDEEGLREALCALGNGYFVTRGASSQSAADGTHYPGTYLAGGFNRLVSDVAGRDIENEDLVNLPNWLPLAIRIDDGPEVDLDAVEVHDYRQELDLRRGLLTRALVFEDAAGRQTELVERRLVSMAEKNLAAIELRLTPREWSGRLSIVSALDGTVINAGVPRYADLASQHLEPVSTGQPRPDTIALTVETTQSRIRIAAVARTRLSAGGEQVRSEGKASERAGHVALEFTVAARPGETLVVEKVVTLCSSRERGISEPGYAALTAVDHAAGFEALLERHVEAWDDLWRRCAIDVDDDHVGMLLHLHLFHVLQTASPHTVDLDAGLPARGLHGEAYRGHIFWDELYVFPFLTSVLPEVTRALLIYRYRRLPAAVWAAREAGLRGAMFPWQSGSDGREETQVMHLNPKSGRWLPDHSHIQRHVNLAIAYNVWHYYEVTADEVFLRLYGAEMLLQVARFLASLTSFDEERGRYVIRGVMGPDEYHDAYPWSDEPGLDNNAYTNVMTSWVLARAADALDRLPAQRRDELVRQLRLGDDELEQWRDISSGLFVPFLDDDIISQFEGYERLEEFRWDAYREKYGDIARLDRILEAEGDTPNRYRLAKQADTVMLFYLFSVGEVRTMLAGLGYDVEEEALRRTIDFYAARTSHGSTLSRVVHAWLLARDDPGASWALFLEALESDLVDIQGGTTREGVHMGVMAGTVDLVRRGYAGVEPGGGGVTVQPMVPPQIGRLRFSLLLRGTWLDVDLGADRRLTLTARDDGEADVKVTLSGREATLRPGESVREQA